MSDKSIIGGVVVLLLAVGTILFAVSGGTTGMTSSGQVDTSTPVAQFAQCLTEKGATFYGAFWCPHCQSQKKLFGNAMKLIHYVECSTPDGNNQLPVCREKGINSYPTWIFADGSILSGEQTFEALAAKTGCQFGDSSGTAPTSAPSGTTEGAASPAL